MKILIKFILILSVLFGSSNYNIANSEESQTTTYAKVLVDCKLYRNKEMNDVYSNILFVIPESYFVVILESVSDDCFKVQYDRFVGYVKSSTIEIATFVPIVKTLNDITFDIKSTAGTQIWSEPTTKSDIKTTISAGTKNIKYIAYSFGSVPSDGESNIWYYVYYTPNENSTNVFEGYIYSENTTNLSEIVLNLECNPEKISDEVESENLIYISSTIKTIVIAIIVIPIILFLLIILYKILKKIKKNTKYANFQNKFSEGNSECIDKGINAEKIDKFKSMTLVENHEDEFDDDLL